MFKRKLLALDYSNATSFNHEDESQFRNLIVWLEDQKVRHYKIEDRAGLRNVCAGDWESSLKKYVEDLGYSPVPSQRTVLLDWILGYAVRLEYGDNIDKYKDVTALGTSTGNKSQAANPIDNLDFGSADFKAGVASLATLLQIPPHQDHLVVLQAVCLLVKEKLSKQALEKAKKSAGKKETQPTIPLEKIETGFEAGDYISAEAAKILRLLHIRDLRTLQTQINEAIVQVQASTANPKTDSRLGKIGVGK